MGGIMCVTPSSTVTSEISITRLSTIPKSVEIGRFGFLPPQLFDRGTVNGLNNIIVHNFNEIQDELDISSADFVWLYKKNVHPLETEGWSGFQEEYHRSSDYDTSRIIPLPFVNNPPSDYNTIFTVLIEAAQKCKARGQERCFITFDQPLYLKAREIISCVNTANDPHNLLSITVRLGGFHMLMSFLGSVGFIMKGSGLKEVFSVLYAEKSAEKALEGHAYSRAIRGHLLIQASISATIFEKMSLSEEEETCLLKYTKEIQKPEEELKFCQDKIVAIKQKFIEHLNKIKEKGPTCKLWIQYFTMINIIKRFIEAERLGNWNLHLQCVKNMLPFFYSSGHHLYAKSSTIYLQDMLKRSDKVWSGIFTDMCIEQVLMKAIKTSGGLTRGRGITDSVVAKWIISTVALTEVCNEMEKFCNASFDTSEQHVDTRISRIKRDAADLQKVLEFFERYNPFPESDYLMSIYSGIVGNQTVNCHNAYEEGMKVLQSHIGKPFGSIKASLKNKVRSLASVMSSVKVQNSDVTINPLLIFQRISLNLKNQDDMKNYLHYELAPFPLSLFDENGLRKTQKSSFYDNFTCMCQNPEITDNFMYVLDGGSLLHRVVWQRDILVKEIIQKYVQYVRQYRNAVVVFDGYPDDTSNSLKTWERCRRRQGTVCREFHFDENTKIHEKQTKFLSNDNNKKRLISMLSTELNSAGFETVIAEEDADALIIQTAYNLTPTVKTVIIIGEDIDLLVLLTQLTPVNQPIYLLKKGRGREVDRWYSNNSFKYPDLRKYIAFLHAASGCDTVSSFYKQGKNKLIKIFISNSDCRKLIDVFYVSDGTRNTISKNMCKIISLLYCNKTEGSLNEHRFEYFKRSSSRSTFKLENLPPTEGAAKQHAFRIYLQLQKWLGNHINVTEWGWKSEGNMLLPIYTDEPLIPDEILKKISCSCTSGCKTKNCGCKKNFLKCTNVCLHCCMTQCDNFASTEIQIDDEPVSALDLLIEENNEEIEVDDGIEENFSILEETEEEIEEMTNYKKRKMNTESL
ncbi:hypothetical protein ALC62_05871 [Cyphomyrmex costatus]|uniref:Tesmin/TSO1-like CXC domain-containing protein n=1 Tax=Cyphomyrmex costatus TaxID=456900 RepID=A0A151IJA8_9HYME|nr:hypothetical protein ALC62_05871 [Cyphomyrmex costatus]